MKAQMFKAAAAAALIAPVTLASAANAAQVEVQAQGPVIELSVFESVTAKPDQATISAGVTTTAPTAVEAMRRNAAEMTRVIAQIKALGIDEDDIQTTGINLNAKYDYNRNTQQQVFRGYQVSNRVSVKMRDIDKTGEVLDALVSAGATNLSGPQFGLEDDEAAKNIARQRAVERSQAQALSYAKMMGYSGVRVLSISESIWESGAIAYAEVRNLSVAEDAPSTPVQPGQVSTGVKVTIQYEMTRS